jgi:hypothetical protein
LGAAKVILIEDKSGFYKGKHFTAYVESVKQLIRENRLDGAGNLLLGLVNATENESNHDVLGVAPWYYEKLAIIYRKKKDLNAEIGILERFARQKHAAGVTPPKLLARLEKLKA